jgi:flagellar export protein FliJ
MGFQFSLATVLRVRGILEEQEERMLQKILFEMAQTRETLASTESALEALDAARHRDVYKPVIGRNIHASYGELVEHKQNRVNLEEKLEKLGQLRDQQLKIYEKAHRNREMLTEMRHEKRSAYETDISRLEQKTLDDIFISRRGRK